VEGLSKQIIHRKPTERRSEAVANYRLFREETHPPSWKLSIRIITDAGSDFLKRLLAMASGEDERANRRLYRRMTPVTVDAILDAFGFETRIPRLTLAKLAPRLDRWRANCTAFHCRPRTFFRSHDSDFQQIQGGQQIGIPDCIELLNE
jgi:hypothetical protein